MRKTESPPRWALEKDDRVRLTGDWNLLFHARLRRRLQHQLAQLPMPRQLAWDLQRIRAFDSSGALLLWTLWGRELPTTLECNENQRHWFERFSAADIPQRLPHAGVSHLVDRIIGDAVALLRTVAGLVLMLGQLIVDCLWVLRHPRLIPWKEISATVYRAGASSLLLIGFVGFLIGVVMTIQIATTLQTFGASHMVVSLMGLAILRELGVVISAIILAGRSGSAMTAGLGAMHITEEFNALRAFGESPSLRLVLPRVIGMTISLPLLVVWADFAGLVGAAITSQAFLGVSWQLFLEQLPNQVPIVNFWIGLIKGMLFGFIISWVATYFGLTAEPNTASLSRNTTLSVVTSLSLILIVDALAGALTTQIGL